MSESSTTVHPHLDREVFAAQIKGLTLEQHLKQKKEHPSLDDEDRFARWYERFHHELTSEFGAPPEGDEEEKLQEYIRGMKKKFRLYL